MVGECELAQERGERKTDRPIKCIECAPGIVTQARPLRRPVRNDEAAPRQEVGMNRLAGAGIGLVTVVAMVGSPGRAVAQNNVAGIKAGITLASADIEDLDGTFSTDNRTGWSAGGFLTFAWGPLAIQPELNYLNVGFTPLRPPGIPEVELRYIAPVVLLKLGIPLEVIRPSIFAGAAVGIELDCQIGGTPCEDAPFPLETGTSDPTAVFGVDTDLYLSDAVALRADVRYAIGFSNIREASDIWREIKNRAWQVQAGLGYRF
jgi:hypothetical protein